MITREYIERKSSLFVERLKDEVSQNPGYRPSEIQLRAAEALLVACKACDPDFKELFVTLAEAKDLGTLGFEMWNFGEQLAELGPKSPPLNCD